jgi:hypothetical protein
VLLEQEASAGSNDPFAEQPVLPVTWLSCQGQGSSTFLVWVAGQSAGQVSSAAAACWDIATWYLHTMVAVVHACTSCKCQTCTHIHDCPL